MNKNLFGIICLYIVMYVGFIFCTELPGLLTPYCWISFGILAAFLAAGPLTVFIHKTGSPLLLPIVWLFVNIAMGELGMTLIQAGMLCLLTIGAILSIVYRNDQQKMMRTCVPVLVAMPSCGLLPLYFQTKEYGQAALEEMGAEYVEQMLGCAHLWLFFVVSALVIGAGIVSQRLTEKHFIKA